MHEAITSRAVGAFLGAAIGDALGAPFEFGPPRQFSVKFPSGPQGTAAEMTGGGGFGWRPGEFTDDTQMAVALAESLVAHDGLDRDDLWARWRVWASDAPDVGVITRSALRHDDWHDGAVTAHRSLGRSAGNGSLMRVTPVAVFTARQGREPIATAVCTTLACQQSALTHHDEAAGWGAAIGAELTRRAILGADPVAEVDAVLAVVPPAHRHRYAQMLHPDWTPERRPDEPGNGSVWGCLAQAVWAVRHHATFAAAVTAAIDLGDDTDTVACVTGALAGARAGIEAIPAGWAQAVHGRVRTTDGEVIHRHDDLVALAHALLGD